MPSWTNPITWNAGDKPSAAVFNAQIRDNQLYLFDRPLGAADLWHATANYQTTSTAWVDVDPSAFAISMTTSGGRLLIGVNFLMRADPEVVAFDITIDGVSIVGGGGVMVIPGNVQYRAVCIVRLFDGLAAGAHTIKLRWRVNSGATATIYTADTTVFTGGVTGTNLAGNHHGQFWAVEL